MATIKDISSLKIKGANFQEETILDLFAGNKISLIYGENGAGKSTIARAIYNSANQTDIHGIKASFLDTDKNEVHIDEASGHVFVFDEDYVQKTVSIKSSTGLNTIVILGELKDVEEKIDAQKSLLKQENLKFQQEKDKLDKMADSKNDDSKSYIENCILLKLKEDNGWADRRSKIRNNKTKAKVNGNTIKEINGHVEFLQDMPEGTRKKSEGQHTWIDSWIRKQTEKYNNALKLYKNTSNANSSISGKISLGSISFDESEFVAALAEVTEKPQITERDELILSITVTLQEKGTDFINGVKEEFENDDVDRCPYCQQKIGPQRKKELLKALGKVLENQTQNHISNQLNQFRINELQTVEWGKYEPLNNPELVDNCKNAIEVFKGRISFVNELLDKKSNNPYQPITLDVKMVKLNAAYESALKNVQSLNEAVADYNKAIKEHKTLENKLANLNNNIAFWEIYESCEKLKEVKKKYGEQQEIVNKLDSKINAIKKEIKVLEEKKKQVKIAVDEINASLAYIFLSSNRLRIEYDSSNDEYKIKVNNMDVRPQDVSVGERNAIALGYFFSDIKKEKEKKNFYQGEYLLVIDDPISSFDRENRIGVISFLRHELLKFKRGNNNTKIVIMTHDMQVLFDLCKMVDSMSAEVEKSQSNKGTFNIKTYILANKEINTLKVNKYQEYSFLLQNIYRFAKGQSCGDLNLEIGNMLRRVLEAYGTFLYKAGGADLFNNKVVLNDIKDANRREFFRNFLIRLFLNGGSHFKEAIQSFNDMNFFSTLSLEKKQEYARYVLCFMYALNPTHVLRHLEVENVDNNELKKQLDEWLHQIDVIANASSNDF